MVLAAAGLFVVTLSASAADNKALDRYLYNSLRYVINHGVDLYNNSKTPFGPEECYQHFRESLEELAPVLTAHPNLQKLIKDSLQKVETDPEWRVKMAAQATMPNPQLAPVDRQKAFALRAVFNEVRAGLNPDAAKMTAGGGAGGRGSGGATGPAGAATVRGTVTAAGKILAKGKITFIGSGGGSYSDEVEADGSYTLDRIPAGAYKITISGDKAVPAKYADPNTTPLRCSVANGANIYNLDVTAQ
jgi:hypothetical protein